MIARTALGKILVFAIFFVGIATGAVLDNVYRTRVAASDTTPNKGERPNPQDRARRDQDQMAKYLGLDQAQQDQIHKILEEMRAQYKDLRDKGDAIQEGSREKIRAVLNDEQRKKLDEFRETHPRGDRGRPPHSPDKDREKDRDKNKQEKQ